MVISNSYVSLPEGTNSGSATVEQGYGSYGNFVAGGPLPRCQPLKAVSIGITMPFFCQKKIECIESSMYMICKYIYLFIYVFIYLVCYLFIYQ